MFAHRPRGREDQTHERRRGSYGAITHTTKSGVADLAFNDVGVVDASPALKQLPAHRNREKAPVRPSGDPIDRMDLSLDTLETAEPEQALRYEGNSSSRRWTTAF
jgi:propionyl-CoA carboxylase beta chain